MAKAIESGFPKLRIEEAASSKQAPIDRGEDVIVGVNKYQNDAQDEIDVLEIDDGQVREAQLSRLGSIRASRDEASVTSALEALTEAAKSGEGNLLSLAIEATRHRTTVGEISAALEVVYGRFVAQAQTVSGVYGAAYADDADWRAIISDIDSFIEQHGRRPRMLVAKMGQDGHDRGAKVIATAFADVGFDVDLSPMFATPEEVARQAIENDVHAVGASSLAAGHKTLVPQLIEALRDQGEEDIIVIAGGVIPQQDYGFLTDSFPASADRKIHNTCNIETLALHNLEVLSLRAEHLCRRLSAFTFLQLVLPPLDPWLGSNPLWMTVKEIRPPACLFFLMFVSNNICSLGLITLIWVYLIWVYLIWVLMIWWKLTPNISDQPIPPNDMTTFIADNFSADVPSILQLISDSSHLYIADAEDGAELIVGDLPVIDMAK